jgi:NAD(P)-dependent dehydrogenase (short-subunit alcohol dehydrogenase family)
MRARPKWSSRNRSSARPVPNKTFILGDDVMIDLSGRVAIVTGAGGGLGREHALLLAARGARVVVNDLAQAAGDAVADEIRAAGGEALAIAASVADFDAVKTMVDEALGLWGQIDILINNAGILRDKTFANMDLADFRLVLDVHLMGAVNCTKAVWDHMRARNYGRIVMTTSSSGLYGNFGQSNYGAAKMALVGLMQTLALEGARNNIRVNCIAPTAATQMLEGLLPQQEWERLHPGCVSPGVLVLAGEAAPTRTILCAGAGSFETAHVTLTQGTFVGTGPATAEAIIASWPKIIDRAGAFVPEAGEGQGRLELLNAGYTRAAMGAN